MEVGPRSDGATLKRARNEIETASLACITKVADKLSSLSDFVLSQRRPRRL